MAEEIPDNRFKSEVMRLLTTFVGRVEENTDGIKQNSVDINALPEDVQVIAGQFHDVASGVIKDTQRITDVENRVGVLEQETH